MKKINKKSAKLTEKNLQDMKDIFQGNQDVIT